MVRIMIVTDLPTEKPGVSVAGQQQAQKPISAGENLL
jgi:hypothetical protein